MSLKTTQSASATSGACSQEPLVSVVIPTYNRALLLQRALKSVLQQTHRNLDVIVVDDASSDDTPEVVRAFDDPRVRYIRNEENRGGAATRNSGIQAAAGEIVAFLDDDDEWEPTKTAEQLRWMKQYAATLCGYHGEERGPARYYQAQPTISLRELQRGFLRGGGTSALMVRTGLLREILFDETLPRCQDWDLCIRLAKRCEIGYVRRPLVRYNDGDHARISNKGRNMSLARLEQELCMVQKHRDFFGPRMYRFHMCRLLLRSIRHRRNKTQHVLYVCRRYGVVGVVSALTDRLYLKMIGKFALP